MELPLESMSTARHVAEVRALRRARREAGRAPLARCTPAGTATGGMVKTVHFVRHGQAAHNALAAQSGATKCGCKRREPGGRDNPRADCPYNADAAFDAALTELGREQALALRERCAEAAVELVVSSPLRRALQTALLAFDEEAVLAQELLREQHGMHRCDRRREREAIAAEQGVRVDVQGLSSADALWTDQREPKSAVADRCEDFLRWLEQQPEEDVAVVAHHHLLLTMFHVAMDCGEDEEAEEGGEGGNEEAAQLLRPFGTGEMRTVCVEFVGGGDQAAGLPQAPPEPPMTWAEIGKWETARLPATHPPPAPGRGSIPGKTRCAPVASCARVIRR